MVALSTRLHHIAYESSNTAKDGDAGPKGLPLEHEFLSRHTIDEAGKS